MLESYLFREFADENGEFGDTTRLILDEGREHDTAQRIAITADFGTDEVVFVNNLDQADVSIYHSTAEVDFAGSVLIGAAWQVSQLKGETIQSLMCKRGLVKVWQEGDVWWLSAGLANNLGNWDYEKLERPQDVESIKVEDTVGWKKMVWAWVDEPKGIVRARTFASTIKMPEVQGNGSGSMNLAGQLQRELTINHGEGSIIYAKPLADGSAALGGRVVAA